MVPITLNETNSTRTEKQQRPLNQKGKPHQTEHKSVCGIKKDGLDIREHFSRNLAEAFELDSNGDFQPSPMNKYIVDTRWDLDDNGDLQMRERELWTLFPDDYFSD